MKSEPWKVGWYFNMSIWGKPGFEREKKTVGRKPGMGPWIVQETSRNMVFMGNKSVSEADIWKAVKQEADTR